MDEQNIWQTLMNKAEENAEKLKAQKVDESLAEMTGLYRRMWREIRLALLDEGVPEDLVDDAVLAFLKAASK